MVSHPLPLQHHSLLRPLRRREVQTRAAPLRHLNPVLLLHQDPQKQILPLPLRLLQVLQGHLPERLHLHRGRLQAAQPQDLLLFRPIATIPQFHFLKL